jgi:hypothetical protein
MDAALVIDGDSRGRGQSSARIWRNAGSPHVGAMLGDQALKAKPAAAFTLATTDFQHVELAPKLAQRDRSAVAHPVGPGAAILRR